MREPGAAQAPGGRPLDVCLVGLLVAAAPHGSGVPRYAAQLTRALDAVADEFPGLALTLLTTPAGAEVAAPRRLTVALAGSAFHDARSGPARLAGEQLAAASRRADLLHFFDLTGPLLRPRRRFTTTIHDASILHGFEQVRHAYKRRVYPWALARAERIVAVSEFAREEAKRHFGIDRGRISVVRSGPGLVEVGATPPPNGLPEPPFLLYVGDLTAKKDVATLVRAHTRAQVDERLVLVGRPRDPYPELDDALAASRERVTVIEGAPDAALVALYDAATALVLPSRYEGFGFTPLEAMARGCPVLASDIPAVREISGDGALLAPVGDEAAWADAIRRIARDETLRADLRARGAETVARYSWDETARGLCRVFASLGAGRRA